MKNAMRNASEDNPAKFEVGKTYFAADWQGEWSETVPVIVRKIVVLDRTAKTLQVRDENGVESKKKIELAFAGTCERIGVQTVRESEGFTSNGVNIYSKNEYTPAIATVSTDNYNAWAETVEKIQSGEYAPEVKNTSAEEVIDVDNLTKQYVEENARIERLDKVIGELEADPNHDDGALEVKKTVREETVKRLETIEAKLGIEVAEEVREERKNKAAVEITYEPQTSWEDPHNYENVGDLSDRALAASNFRIARYVPEVISDGFDAEVFNLLPTLDETDEDDDNPEADIINVCRLNFVNFYSSPQEERGIYSSERVLKIGDNHLTFDGHKLVRVEDPHGFILKIGGLCGRKNKRYTYNGNVVSRQFVLDFTGKQELAAEQEARFRKFFITDEHKNGFFQVTVRPTFADGVAHNYAKYFDRWADATVYLETAKEFVGDVPCAYAIRDRKCYGVVRYTCDENGTERYDLPDVDYFIGASIAEIQTRIDELKAAGVDNYKFYKDETQDSNARGKARRTLVKLDDVIDYYEFILHSVAVEESNTPDEPNGMKTAIEVSDTQDTVQEETATVEPPIDEFTAERDRLMSELATANAKVEEAEEAVVKARQAEADARAKAFNANEKLLAFTASQRDSLKKKFKTLPSVVVTVKTIEGFTPLIHTDDLIVSVSDARQFRVECYVDDATKLMTLGIYDTPAQVEAVIEEFKAAISRRPKYSSRVCYAFPKAADVQTAPATLDKHSLADSLERAMKESLKRSQNFCRIGEITAAENELTLYQICRKAYKEVI